MAIEFLIIGQGLAGSLLAFELLKRGAKVVVVDNGVNNASLAAAGLINPVTGLRWVKSTAVDDLLPVAKQVYQDLANFFGQTFYIEKPMLRVLTGEADLTWLTKRLSDSAYSAYLDKTQTFKQLSPFQMPLGMHQQQQTGYLLTRPLLTCLREFFIAKGCYLQAPFDFAALTLTPSLRWQHLTAKQLIFCEGHSARFNPYFYWLPFQVVKGEILTLSHSLQLPDQLLNFGHWLIPLTENRLRIGATFDRVNLNTQITASGKQQLLNSLTKICPPLQQAQLLEQAAHIRPCTLDKQPFIGFHPAYSQLALFNGFGAKGSLQIPWCAQQFADSLLNATPIVKAYDIQRYYSRYVTH